MLKESQKFLGVWDVSAASRRRSTFRNNWESWRPNGSNTATHKMYVLSALVRYLHTTDVIYEIYLFRYTVYCCLAYGAFNGNIVRNSLTYPDSSRPENGNSVNYLGKNTLSSCQGDSFRDSSSCCQIDSSNVCFPLGAGLHLYLQLAQKQSLFFLMEWVRRHFLKW